jgi:hypothetical protein
MGRLAAAAVCAVAAWACETAVNSGGIQRDQVAPRITLTTPNKATPKSDTQTVAAGLTFTVTASDNVALDSILLTFSVGYVATLDTGFTGQVQSATLTITVPAAQLAGSGGQILVIGTAKDGAGNRSKPDTISIFLSNNQALATSLLAPTAGAIAGTGKYIGIVVKGVQQAGGIRRIGWTIGGAAGQTAVTGDSLINASAPFPDSTTFTDSVLVSGNSGNFTVIGFAVDSAGRRSVSAPVQVTIQAAGTDNTPPEIAQTVPLRAEATDSIIVHATDPSGITRVGFVVKNLLGATIGGDSLNFAGTNTDQRVTLGLKLASLAPLPAQVVVQAFAIDGAAAKNRGVTGSVFTVPSAPGSATARADTVTIVAGRTFPLPAGSQIGDAIFDKNTQQLYMTNTALSRVEVFQVANSTFVAGGINTAGPQPVGIALWPRDTLGGYADTIVVANSGGTELTVINVGAGGPQQILWRQALPNFVIEKYQTINVGGFYEAQITYFDISDRPQYVSTICRPNGGTACAPDSVFAIYSTTPTASSASPFSGRGTLRMEKLTSNPAQAFGHFFWEIGSQSTGSTADTLRIEEDRNNVTTVVLSACAGVTIDFSSFGLGDSTFVRNSGNFTHAFMGEGGNISAQFARVMSYNAQRALVHGAPTFATCKTSPDTIGGPVDAGDNDRDFGMSPAFQVSDFISNTGITIGSIATNFNGLTNAVRADSVYYLDQNLRLAATSPAGLGSPGMDMNANHTFAPFGTCSPCGGAGSPNDRIIFAAQPDGTISVFDTFHGAQVGTIQIRDPIIGPLRVAKDALGNQLLFGITSRGLVMVALPTIVNPLPSPRRTVRR